MIGVGILMGRSPGLDLVRDALWMAGCTVAAGLLMTGLLPFVERFFGVQTDLSLLELGDVAHPLLQELVRRAPGTYNHSINVASIAEAAAESIGANGLLVRVGAYFHDIGKMLKPGYFVENQGGQGNCHESLLPAMSTLVIIAHVKDGADLARQAQLAQLDHGLHPAASRDDAGRVFLSPGQSATGVGSGCGYGRRRQLSLSGPQTADTRGRRVDAGRCRGERRHGRWSIPGPRESKAWSRTSP